MTQLNITANSDSSAPSNMHSTKKISTAHLLQGNKSLIIQHGDSEYLLTVTRSNKLILTK